MADGIVGGRGSRGGKEWPIVSSVVEGIKQSKRGVRHGEGEGQIKDGREGEGRSRSKGRARRRQAQARPGKWVDGSGVGGTKTSSVSKTRETG